MEQHDLSINDVKLHIRVSGDPDAPPLLLLHGWPDSGRCWTKVAPLLADRYRVIVPDLRGFGVSDAPPELEAYRMPVLLGDIAGLIEWAGGGPVYIAGHDFGGALTWQAATWLGNLLNRAVVLAAPHPLRMREVGAGNVDQLSRSFYVWLMQSGGAGMRLLSSDDFSLLARFAFGTSAGFTDEDREAYRAEWRTPGRFEAMANWYRANFRPDLFNPEVPLELPQVQVPVRYIHGEFDWAFAPGMETGSGAFVDADFDEKLIGKASHWMPQERPEEVAELIGDWMSR
ncbi:MAG TPA: alpha/beta fold hydrolase [Acidimicrobiia bacterium]|nr:alpha/beta fold hydrolase [Acidimicrobiia bacterium]